MIYARNKILVSKEAYRDELTFNLDNDVFANKLSVQVLSENDKGEFVYGPVILQVTERPEHTYENDLNTEQYLELGFQSRGFVSPITGARFRLPGLDLVPAVKPALLHFVFYG